MRSKSEIQNEIDEMQSKIERLNSILSAMDRSNWNYKELGYQRRGCQRKLYVLRLEKAETQEEKEEIMQEIKDYCLMWLDGETMALAKVSKEGNYAGQIEHKKHISWLEDELQSIVDGAYIPTEDYIKRADLPINDTPPPRSSSSSSSNRRTGGIGCGCLTITLTIVAVFVICISMLL